MSTYTPIASQVLTSTAASITFESVPQNYADLYIVIRGDSATTIESGLRFNNDSGSNYSSTRIYNASGGANSDRFTSGSYAYIGDLKSAGQTVTVIQVANYCNTTTYKTVLTRSGYTDYQFSIVSLWRNTSAVNALTLIGNGGSWSSGTTFDLYGIATGSPKANGGNIVTTDGTYWYHAFTTSGAFIPISILTADVLVVAGGGAGWGGGGGAGGLLGFNSQSLTLSTSYIVTVGAGGTGTALTSTNGNDSQFGSLTLVKGGGKSGNDYVTDGTQNGAPGGSGGGGGRLSGTGGSPTSGQGFAGGTADATLSSAGGGGAGAVGNNSAGSQAGAGGVGSSAYSSWGSATSTGENSGGTYYYAGGGGGFGASGTLFGAGGLGGGGRGSTNAGGSASGTASTGGAGGAAAGGGTGLGGSGIVIVRYAV